VKVLVTGCAGFIGYHVVEALLARGDNVVGLDNLNTYYDVRLKQARLDRLDVQPGFGFHRVDVSDKDSVGGVVAAHRDIEGIVHLAAQAGVRYSLVDPYAYVQTNVMGHLVVLEAARLLPALRHLVYASTSSVYGLNESMPFQETDRVDTPASLYAATKRADELMSHAYAHLFGLPQTGLRFFTVYGPWGRPDMAYFSFAQAIVAGEPITLYDGGRLKRDFTYIDDIVAGTAAAIDRESAFATFNLGNSHPEALEKMVTLLEEALGKKAIRQLAPMQAGDIVSTWADIKESSELLGYTPKVGLAEGIQRFVDWYVSYHQS
jgi:UDP-glucuronate 4-epimerase